LAEKFEAIIDEPMKALGCCCGQKPRFRPMPLYCFSSSACCIPVNAAYYSSQDKCVIQSFLSAFSCIISACMLYYC